MKKPIHLFSALVALAAAAGFSASASAQESSPSASASPAAETSSTTPSTSTKSGKTEGTKKTNATLTTAESTAGAQATKGTSTGQLSSADRKFMMNAAKGGMMEVHMGQMAEKQGQSAEVKKIGARMVADHTKVNNELMSLAQAKGVKLDTRHKMDKMDSANFDQMYLDQMVKDHEKDIAEFQTQAKSGTDPELKSFAAKNLPTLKKHLEMVKAAQGKMPKKS